MLLPYPISIPDLTKDAGRRSCEHKSKQGVDVFWLGPRHPSSPESSGLPQEGENSEWTGECWKEKFGGYHRGYPVSLTHPGSGKKAGPDATVAAARGC